jgi:hypothetical protein
MQVQPTETQLRTLHAALDRIIPADDSPGASDAGVANYILRQLNGDLRSSAKLLLNGLTALDGEAVARFGKPLADIAESDQDQLLTLLEAGEVKTTWPSDPRGYFNFIVRLAMEGFYSDPGNGGNKDQASWKMMGYQPRGQIHK